MHRNVDEWSVGPSHIERMRKMTNDKGFWTNSSDGEEVRMDETKEMHHPEDASGGPRPKVRPKGKAVRAILDYLDANDEALPDDIGQFEVNDAVTKAVDALYDAYAADGTVPTREAFAERCGEPSIGEAVRAMPEDPFVRKVLSRKAVAAICAGCVAAVVIVGCGVALALGSGGTPDALPQTAVTGAEGPETEAEEVFVLPIGVVAEGWDGATSSPVIVHIVSEAEGIDYYHAFDANEAASLAVPAGGEYEVSFVSPVNADGSIYRVPGAVTVTAVEEVDATDDDLPFEFERVPAEDVTAEELTDIMGQVAEAIKRGDETLAGDGGAEVAETVEENIKANPNADKEAVEEESSEATEAAEQESEAQTGGTSDTGGNTGGSASTSKPSGDGGESSKPASPSGGSGSGSAPSGGSSSSKPSHTHNWVAQTKTVHHDAEYKTVHHDAVTENRSICNSCGADITGNESAHMKEYALNGDMTHSYSVKPVVVQAAYNENVLVKDAWDEQVLVKAAWDETVTTGYKCSTCGATK